MQAEPTWLPGLLRPGMLAKYSALDPCQAKILIRCAFLHLGHKLLSLTSQGCNLPAVHAVVVRSLPATTSGSGDYSPLGSTELG